MSTTTKENVACEAEHKLKKYSSLSDKLKVRAKSNAEASAHQSRPTPDDYPALPTAEQYRQGMERLRAQINCPVLSLEPEPVIDDYLNDDLRAAKKRKTAAEYLKARHRAALLERMPRFEQDTINSIENLHHEIDTLSFKLMITNCVLSVVVIIGSLAWVF